MNAGSTSRWRRLDGECTIMGERHFVNQKRAVTMEATLSIGSLLRAWSTLGLFAWPVRSDWQSVVLWWEVRRIPYNIAVGLVGTFSLVSMFFLIAASDALEPGEEAIELVGLFVLPLLGGIFFNVCYTAGWVLELLVRSAARADNRFLGPILFTGGLLLSFGIVLLPAVLWATHVTVKWLTA